MKKLIAVIIAASFAGVSLGSYAQAPKASPAQPATPATAATPSSHSMKSDMHKAHARSSAKTRHKHKAAKVKTDRARKS